MAGWFAVIYSAFQKIPWTGSDQAKKAVLYMPPKERDHFPRLRSATWSTDWIRWRWYITGSDPGTMSISKLVRERSIRAISSPISRAGLGGPRTRSDMMTRLGGPQTGSDPWTISISSRVPRPHGPRIGSDDEECRHLT
ncbi:uncharacterized protein Z518_05837 [Rhinocladiella mackenziei CBS 650.93]|uniref:Uncharacterized protein n=1 Tax=Rhinocladiella mackenziei CBS 650.93 TaxID=1442369 RepID=A0A0D2J7C1_9EURO|nr:uncharacterized protein Z518_05837 [Rhinocladiella mackenziei CBS 650.93]KIX04965.1 hypothetical protein Z518_05837 [Rhinocladiella mackenziei CBS 650.93]